MLRKQNESAAQHPRIFNVVWVFVCVLENRIYCEWIERSMQIWIEDNTQRKIKRENMKVDRKTRLQP